MEGNYRVDVYEDDSGVRVYMVNGRADLVYWAASYEDPEEAAADFAGLTIQCLDPIAEGWEWGGFSSIWDADGIRCDDPDCAPQNAQSSYENECGEMIASSSWYRGKDSDMLRCKDPEEFSDVNASLFAEAFMGKPEEA